MSLSPEQQTLLAERLQTFCEVLTRREQERNPDYMQHYTFEGGPKYYRIVAHYTYGGKAAHAFVNKTNGDLLKCGGWSGPQRSKDGKGYSNFNLLNDLSFQALLDRAEFTSSYTYDGRKVDL